MALPDLLQGLLNATAYPHTCEKIELIETHISWVLLTGDFVYKLKKPVKFSFLDFSTPEQREHFCREELRCNRAFAPALYLDVVPVILRADGSLAMGGIQGEDDTVLEWAVKMRQFDPATQLDLVLERGELSADMLAQFGRELAELHAALPRLTAEPAELEQRIFGPVQDNFTEIGATGLQGDYGELLEEVRELTNATENRLKGLITERLRDGYMRECHGDLHLSNLALIDNQVIAFDCLEFNPFLRWIDTLNDVAFLFMDCCERDRTDLAYTFLNAYLDASGDYRGAELLPYFSAYRSMVRAKVAALRWDQEASAASEARFKKHVEWARDCLGRPTGMLILMCGLSGSGKSYVAERLAPRLPAIRLRSDVARKTLAGLDTLAQTDSPVGGGLYATGRSDEVFDYLADVATALLSSGEHVIVDATFIEKTRRQPFLKLAESLNATVRVLFCEAPLEVLQERIRKRSAKHHDASEATLEVLESQRTNFVPPGDDEPVLRFEADQPLNEAVLDSLAAVVIR